MNTPGTAHAADPRPFDLVVFDFDGTLADSLPWFVLGVNDAALRYGFRKIDDGEFDSLRLRDPAAVMEHLRLPMWRMPFVVRRVRAVMSRHIDDISLFGGVPQMLRALDEAGMTLALVTTNSERNARTVLGELASLFSHFGCGAPIFGKAAKLRQVLRASGIRADRTISIGDELRDIDAARAVGAACGAVSWGYADVDALRGRNPDQVYATVEDIVAQLTASW